MNLVLFGLFAIQHGGLVSWFSQTYRGCLAKARASATAFLNAS
jgi:hypothetical protein